MKSEAQIPTIVVWPNENKLSYFGHVVYNPSQKLIDIVSKQLEKRDTLDLYARDEFGWVIKLEPYLLPLKPDDNILTQIEREINDRSPKPT